MKNNELLLDVIGDADDALIPETDTLARKRFPTKSALIATACAVLALCAALLPLRSVFKNKPSVYEGLPCSADFDLRTGNEKFDTTPNFGSMGFEGMMAYDISELDTASPWNGKADTLPVFCNLAFSEENADAETYGNLSAEQLKSIARNTAAALDTSIISTDTEQYSGILHSLNAKCKDDITITVYGDGQICISFEKSVALPRKYSFTNDRTTDSQAEAALEYLSRKYAAALGFRSPVCYSYADRSFSGEQIRSYCMYEYSADEVRSLLNHSLASVRFCPDDNGALMCIWIDNAFCSSEYIGNYGIIDETKAKKLLLNGEYYSSVPSNFLKEGKITADAVAKCELVYRNSKSEAFFQPYYRFYVELDPNSLNMADGLKNFGIFYVSALSLNE